MKKILIIIMLILLTGCKNNLVCEKKTDEELYESKQKITFNFKDNKASVATIDHIMTFEDESTAKKYSAAFEALENDYKIELKNNIIKITETKDYSKYNQTKDELKTKLKENGYECR